MNKIPKKSDFNIIIQEAWETVGNATQIDDRFVNMLYKALKQAGEV